MNTVGEGILRYEEQLQHLRVKLCQKPVSLLRFVIPSLQVRTDLQSIQIGKKRLLAPLRAIENRFDVEFCFNVFRFL